MLALPPEVAVKLYDSKMAPNPRRVRIFLAEKGLSVPTVQVDIGAARENRKPPYIDKNPLGGTPMLELDDGTCIAESVAICRYFEETHPDPPLLGVDAADRAIVEMWQRRMELEVFRNVTATFQNTHDFFKGRIEQVPAFGEVARKAGRARLAWLDGELASRPFVAGDRYTIADITLLCALDFGRVVDIRPEPDQKNLQRWHESVSARPSAKA
jgi:glutathione S-transferase